MQSIWALPPVLAALRRAVSPQACRQPKVFVGYRALYRETQQARVAAGMGPGPLPIYQPGCWPLALAFLAGRASGRGDANPHGAGGRSTSGRALRRGAGVLEPAGPW